MKRTEKKIKVYFNPVILGDSMTQKMIQKYFSGYEVLATKKVKMTVRCADVAR